ncbi:MAG: hypothetical protein NTY56_03285, partial [Patescibacteria group bacterium]|nr:hypothetical protein [Patescibacteria group bacterium]
IEITTEDVKTKELNYLLVNLIDMNTTTKANYGKLTDQSAEGTSNLGEKLLDLVKQEKIPILHKDILKRSSSLRPIAISGKKLKDVDPEQSLNTSYPAYKIDVQGSNNRAIILKLENTSEGMPVYAVVAIYDHDDDKAIHKNLFLKQKKNK